MLWMRMRCLSSCAKQFNNTPPTTMCLSLCLGVRLRRLSNLIGLRWLHSIPNILIHMTHNTHNHKHTIHFCNINSITNKINQIRTSLLSSPDVVCLALVEAKIGEKECPKFQNFLSHCFPYTKK